MRGAAPRGGTPLVCLSWYLPGLRAGLRAGLRVDDDGTTFIAAAGPGKQHGAKRTTSSRISFA
jgi:hypothetical protein